MKQKTSTPQGRLAINGDMAKKTLFEKLNPKEQEIIGRVIYAGMKFLFGTREMNDKIVEGIQKTQKTMDISDCMGIGLGHTMIMLYNESKGTMPVGALLPAGYVLLAKMLEFVHDTKVAKVTDDDFGEALQMMSAVINRVLNPKYNSDLVKQAQSGMAQGQPPAQPGMLGQPAPQGA